MTKKPELSVVAADPVSPSFESLPAAEKQKLVTYGLGEAPYPGYEYDWAAARWKPGPGVVDVHAGMKFDAPPRPATARAEVATANPASGSVVYLTESETGVIIAAYANRERAMRDVEMVGRATNVTLSIRELPIEV